LLVLLQPQWIKVFPAVLAIDAARPATYLLKAFHLTLKTEHGPGDFLFGTIYVSGRRPGEYGLCGTKDVSQGWVRQLLYPFRRKPQ
jgi:hypothetical protein